MALGDQGGHIEAGTQRSRAGFGNMGFAANRRAGLTVFGVEAGEGDNVTDIGEGLKIGQFSQEFGSGKGAEALNGINQVTLPFEIRILVNVVLNSPFDLLDLFGEELDLRV